MATCNFAKSYFTDSFFVRKEASGLDLPKINITNLEKKYRGVSFYLSEVMEWNNDRNRPLFRGYCISISKVMNDEECFIKLYYGYRAGYYEGVNLDIKIDDCYYESPESIDNEQELWQAINNERYGKRGKKTFYNAVLHIINKINFEAKKWAEHTLIETARFSNGEAMYRDISNF